MNTASLLSLPDETLIHILKIYLHGLASDLRTQPTEYKNPKGPWAGDRQAVWTLSLTNRRLSRLATPFLYRHVIIWSGSSLALLFHTLLVEAPQRGDLMRSFALVAPMDAEFFERNCWSTFTHLDWKISSMGPRERRVFNLGICEDLATCLSDDEIWLIESYRGWSALSQSVLGGTLCIMPAIENLQLHVADHERYFGISDTTPYADLEEILDHAFHDEIIREKMLSSLLRLRLASFPEAANEEIGMDWILRLARFPSHGVKKIDLLGDRWQAGFLQQVDEEFLRDPVFEEEAPALKLDPKNYRNVEVISSQWSDTSGRGWHDFLSLCPKLKAFNLDVAPTPGFPPYFFFDYLDEEENQMTGDLNTALVQRRKTLEILRISAGLRKIRRDELIDGGWLSCLPSMENVRTLRVDINLLFEELGILATKNPKLFLPPNLKSLAIQEAWGKQEEDVINASDESKQLYGLDIGVVIHRIMASKLSWLKTLESFEWWQQWDYWQIGDREGGQGPPFSRSATGVAFTARDSRGNIILS